MTRRLWALVVWLVSIAVGAQGLPSEPTYTGQPLSLHLPSVEVRAALQVLADFSGLNLVVSDGVTGNLSLRLQQVPWDQVLDIIVQAKGLHARRQGNVLWVAPRAEVASRDKAMMEAWQAQQQLAPLETRRFALNYAKAVEVQARLQGGGTATASAVLPPHTGPTSSAGPPTSALSYAGGRVLSPRGSVVADPRTNQLFVTDVAERLVHVDQMVSQLDIPLRQVLIEARIVQADDSFGHTLGVRLNGSGQSGHAVWGANAAATLANANPVTGQGTAFEQAGQALNTSGQFVNLPARGLNGVEPSGFAISIFNAGKNRLLSLELSALEADGKGKVVSSPRVVTADQNKAVIEQGTELPYQTAAGTGITTIAFRKANLRLEVTPQITPEGSIVLDLDLHKDSVGQSTAAGFAIDTKHVNTQVRVDDGGTVMIGGIYETTLQDDQYRVPLLGDLPWLGALFRQRQHSQTKQELLVFITPKMLAQSASAR